MKLHKLKAGEATGTYWWASNTRPHRDRERGLCVDGRARALMKPLLLAVLKLLAAALAFVGVLAGCLAVMLMLLMMLRMPVVLVAVLLACIIFITLQHLKQKRTR